MVAQSESYFLSKSNAIIVRYGLVLMMMLTLSACGPTKAPSALGLYGPTPSDATVKSSNAQARGSRVFEFTFDEVFDAAHEAAFRKGLNIEKKDRKNGVILGSGFYQTICGAGPCQMVVTFAVYVKEISSKPETQLTFVLDRHSMMAWGGEQGVVNNFIIDTQKILATYR